MMERHARFPDRLFLPFWLMDVYFTLRVYRIQPVNEKMRKKKTTTRLFIVATICCSCGAPGVRAAISIESVVKSLE